MRRRVAHHCLRVPFCCCQWFAKLARRAGGAAFFKVQVQLVELFATGSGLGLELEVQVRENFQDFFLKNTGLERENAQTFGPNTSSVPRTMSAKMFF
jgi:hypothetical protein